MSEFQEREKLGRIWVPKEAGLVPNKGESPSDAFYFNSCKIDVLWLVTESPERLKNVCVWGAGVRVDKGKGNIYVYGLTSRRGESILGSNYLDYYLTVGNTGPTLVLKNCPPKERWDELRG